MADIKLCFIPHAGGSAMGYKNFKMFLDSSIIPVPIEPAGRGTRIAEKPFTNIQECVEDIYEHYKDIFTEGNTAIFGHSMGSVLAYELIKFMKKKNCPLPVHYFSSGRVSYPEMIPENFVGLSKLNDEDFLAKFSESGGFPDVVLKNKDLMNMLMPVLRADVKMVDDYVLDRNDLTVDCDVTVFFGKSDKMYDGSDLEQWKTLTTGKCDIYGFNGEHFYFSDPVVKKELCSLINQIILNK